jgi:hypothetical protein
LHACDCACCDVSIDIVQNATIEMIVARQSWFVDFIV